MNNLDRTKKLRAVARTLTTKLINKVENVLIEDIDDNVLSNLRELLEQLNVKSELLRGYDIEIEKLITKEDELENEIETAQEYQEKIITFKCKIKDKLRVHEIKNESIISNSEIQFVQNSVPKISVKLPKLNISKYFGDPSNWLEFWNQFESAIHTNDSISSVDKFNYLKSLCGGLALNAISGLALTAENYSSAIDILKDRFGRNDLIINAHMNKLLNLDSVKNSSNVFGLRKLYDNIEINIRSLESLNVVTGTYGHLLYPILMKLLPSDLALEFDRKHNSRSEFDIKLLLEFLKTEIQCRENICSLNNKVLNSFPVNQNYYNDKGITTVRKYQNANFKREIPSTTALTTTVNRNCIFCEIKDHDSEHCSMSIEERKNVVKKRGYCFKCLRRNHLAKNCWRKVTCTLCKRNTHNTLLCEKLNLNPEIKNSQVETDIDHKISKAISTTVSTCNASNVKPNTAVFLQTCTAVITSKFKNKLIRILIDGGSHRTFISKDLVDELKLPVIRTENLQIHAFGEENPSHGEYECVKVYLKNPHNQNMRATLNALVVNRITGADVVNIPNEWIKRKLKEMSLCHSDNSKLPIHMLIGADSYWEIVTGNIHRLSKRLVALETLFGTTLQGQAAINYNPNSKISVNKILVDQNKDILNDIKTIWELETLGIKENENINNEEEDNVLREFENSIVYKDKRYEARLLWKMDPVNLDNNYENAEQRLKGLNTRLIKNSWLFKQYEEILNDQLSKNIIEECEFSRSDKCYFMPHHPVIRNDKSTKVRIVYDASSKGKNNLSLNDYLLSGANLNPNILDVILKFRERKIAYTADIEAAFLQIAINSVDRNYLRFLYSKSCSLDENLKCYRMTRVGFGIKCSPYILACVIKQHIKKFEKTNYEAFKMLSTSLYVDDLCHGSDSVQEALCLSISAVNILKEASMNLRKFKTNSEELRKKWEENNISLNEESGSNKLSKILGLNWDTRTDSLKVDVQPLLSSLKNVKNTKRSVLQCAARCFDPAGFLTPFMVKLKSLMQVLWVKGLDWDEPFDNDITEVWQEWCSEVKYLAEFSLPRHFFETDKDILPDSIQLHVFSDASLKAYGAVAYFRYMTEKKETKTTFIMSKSRIAPLKKITLPRMELLGALIAARLGNYIQRLFSVQHVKYWTDSTITLHWIKGLPSRWKQFVCNRVTEIQELSNPEDWRHCDGKTNPADLLTRGCSVKELIDNDRWKKGPTWMSKDENFWPKIQIKEKISIEEERRKAEDTILINTVSAEEDLNILSKFSSWMKLQRIIAWCLRFTSNCVSNNRKVGSLTTDEIRHATNIIIKRIQSIEFPTEIKCLEKGKQINCQSNIISLNPLLDEKGIMRVGGRLNNAQIPENCKHPILLPKNNYVTSLIIKHYHDKHLHGGVQLLLSAILQNYWIVNARSEIKKIIWKCVKCRRIRANRNISSQIMADLPPSRVIPCRVFSKIGVDFAGPFFVKMRKGRGIKPIKCYVCVFVCLVTKAVHLELVNDLTSEAFLASLRRFTSRRGLPQEIYSDCGTNFVGAEKILRKLISLQSNSGLNNWILSENIKWKFNPPGAPHHGGLWEAAVKSMKQHLRKTIGKQILTYEEFYTLLCQVEACLNSRPMTPISNDPNDLKALTPGHFLIGTSLTALPEQDLTDQNITSLRRWQLTQQMYQTFWKRWSREYLCQLQQRCKWKTPKSDIKLHDLVIIKEDNLSPLLWKLGRVIEVYPGADKKVRIVKIKTQSGEIKRPITKLSVLINKN